MKSFLMLVLYALIAAGALVGALYIRGKYLPESYAIQKEITLGASQANVWTAITDVAAQKSWRTDLKSIEPLPSVNGDDCFREGHSLSIKVSFCQDVESVNKKLVQTTTDPEGFFVGTRTFSLTSSSPTITRLSIVEEGHLQNPLARFLVYENGAQSPLHEYVVRLEKHLQH